VRCADSVLEPCPKVFPEVLLVQTLENVQVLYSKLLVLAPPQPQPRPAPLRQPRRVQQVEDTLVVNLQKRQRNRVAAVFVALNLLEQTGEYLRDDAGVALLRLLPLHRVGLAGTCLAVCEDGGVVALEGLVNEVVDVALLIEVLLGDLLVENVVEIEVFGVGTVEDLNLLALGVDLDVGIEVAVLGLGF
jgi:hypothetical protein